MVSDTTIKPILPWPGHPRRSQSAWQVPGGVGRLVWTPPHNKSRGPSLGEGWGPARGKHPLPAKRPPRGTRYRPRQVRAQPEVPVQRFPQSAGVQMSPEAVTRTHQAAHQTIGALVERGRADGSFRTDLPAGWLVTASIALVHTCADEVRAGRIAECDEVPILTATVRDLFTGTDPAGPRPGPA